jgi:hypothetical protein
VQGGSWPFQYALTQAPSGMTVGEQYGAPNYGVIEWANPTVGTHTVSVRVRGQEYGRNVSGLSDEQTVTFTLTVSDREDTSKFIWLDSNAAGGGNGSYTTPFNTLAAGLADSHTGKQMHFKAGTYTTSRALNTNNDAGVWIGHGSPTVNISFGAPIDGHWQWIPNGGYRGGINFQGGKNYVIRSGGNIGRQTLFECNFAGYVWDPAYESGDGNHGYFVALQTGSGMRRYISVVNCNFSQMSGLQTGALFVSYATEHIVFEGNTWETINAGSGIYPKGASSYVTVRNNRMYASNWCRHLYIYQGTYNYPGYNNIGNEVCWNYAKSVGSGSTTDQATLDWGRSSSTEVAWEGWAYRNTIVGAVVFIEWNTSRPSVIYVDNNVFLNSSGTANDMTTNQYAATTIANNNILRTKVNEPTTIDADGKLLDSYLTANNIVRGTIGHEIAGAHDG